MTVMRILLVEDDPAVRSALDRALRLEGFTPLVAIDGAEGRAMLRAERPDIVVLDLGLPDMDGLDLCRRIRAEGDRTPILILTAREQVPDRVAGLDAGADDYLAKPFALDELLARLRALGRRAATEGEAPLRFGDIVMDPVSYKVHRGERELELTRTEYQLLKLFLQNPRRVLTREIIFDRVWGYDFGPNSNSLDVYIGYLRRKLETNGEPRVIQTVRGVGYVLREEP